MNFTNGRLVMGAVLTAVALALAPARADEPDEADLDSYIEVAGDPAEAKRVQAVDQIARYGAKAKKAIPVLLKCLKAEGRLGASAARALAAVGPAAAKEGAPALREHLAKFSDATFQGPVAVALSQLAPHDKQTVKALNDLLGQIVTGSDASTQTGFTMMRSLAEALGWCGKDAAPAVKNLYAFASRPLSVRGQDRFTGRTYQYSADDATLRPYRLAVVKALQAIGTKEAQGRLGRIKVNASDPELKKAATRALAELKAAAEKAK